MTVLAPPANVTPRPSSFDPGSPGARIRHLLATIRASEYLVVGGSRRFRAGQRGRTRIASRAGFPVVAAVAALDATVMLGHDVASVRPAIAIDVLIMTAALAGWWQMPRRLHHHPEAAAFAVMLGITVSTVVSGTFVPTLAAQTVGYLLLLPSWIAAAKAAGRNQVRYATGLAA